MTARPARRRSAYAALALGLAGSLALTGCHSGSAKSRKSSSSSNSRSKKRKIIGGAAAAGVGAGAARRRSTITCSPDTSRLGFSQQAGPKGYVTVRYTNRSSTLNCRLYGGPLLSFDGAKTPLPMLRAGQGNGVRLRPGATAYAVIPTNTPAALGTPQKTVNVQFAGSSQGSTTGSPVTYDLVAKHTTLSVGQGKVSFWNPTLSSARTEAGVGS
ncbi:DUF4232 domain-containing protein [Streptomyces sp. NPDC057743]|uniref:DUF4232 domain-containing protein n=1 Tax=Streptomyces sp. NPDC057743 TaxID=3346236 RepID=UPI00367D425F